MSAFVCVDCGRAGSLAMCSACGVQFEVCLGCFDNCPYCRQCESPSESFDPVVDPPHDF